ncbi:polysaccharide deacetylase [Leptomonas pyrrhocoris]|uniref:Polysaccharide deacetylase n=1 Tax=Leptomonas pyrrhocoris TaxID=157538 RepID=A0A0M9FUS2_LEPPY|nr:polysaccharide deacetylase [Leptomonas pyrrhocoris]XP_015654945.1 polysaccharide deacetylase [Leptomonas pyrrhocoris]KPA76505.1 polysaccharide deacetylase [Leptomonas pyrrhocoris]KPA76506.1 polysaccharide deacetylase [Leptomonas pyrrhocoris]|eukprot:XP_015654944.1 polysaccharide deacetylase [Leptomonas pyrrhocoris]
MNNDVDIYERDIVGYGGQPPEVHWPNEANIAINFVVNYEAGSERTVLNDDACSERFLSDMVGTASIPGARCAQIESMYEYGSRAGFWRLRDAFAEAKLPVTIFGVARALELNPAVVAAMQEQQWEIATHGYRWLDFQDVPMEDEQEQLKKAIDIHTRVTGKRPVGYYIGRTSPNSARICALEGGFLYDADSYADDLPYYTQPLRKYNGDEGCQLVVPYSLDVNDMKYVAYNGFTESQQFFQYLKDQFDVLYDEGARGRPKMMSVGLHCRVAGKPARAAGLRRFLAYIQTKEKVWVATRQAIAEHWLAHHPPPQPTFYQRTHGSN